MRYKGTQIVRLVKQGWVQGGGALGSGQLMTKHVGLLLAGNENHAHTANKETPHMWISLQMQNAPLLIIDFHASQL